MRADECRLFPFENSLPRRGCVGQPRVTVVGYPGNVARLTPTPTGLRPAWIKEQEEGIALVSGGEYATRNAPTVALISGARSYVCVIAIRCVHATPSTIPLGLERTRQSPRVAVLGNPGLNDATPLGLTDTAG